MVLLPEDQEGSTVCTWPVLLASVPFVLVTHQHFTLTLISVGFPNRDVSIPKTLTFLPQVLPVFPKKSGLSFSNRGG